MASEGEAPEGKRVGNSKYVCGKYITGGSFGKLYTGRNTETNQEVAIKLEPKGVKAPQLPLEYSFYKILGKGKGIPNIYYFGPCGGWIALVMDMLGPSLEKMHEKCDRKFSLRTTTQLAIQLIAIFDVFHGKRLVYRDTKPDNFLLGLSGTDMYNVVYIIDMGLCKEYKNESGVHIPQASGKMFTGTVRYMSINNHQNIEQSRRDDLEALGYMLIYFHKGWLPWQGVQIENVIERYRAIGEIKRKTELKVLCSEMPDEYQRYFQYIKALEFTEEPKYKVYINLFTKLLNKLGHDSKEGVYDWDRNHKPRPSGQRK